MNEMFEEIKERLEKLQAEVERLQTENNDLRKKLENYKVIESIITGKKTEVIPEEKKEAVVEKDDREKMKDYVYGLAESLIEHTAENEVAVITELMRIWKENKLGSVAPFTALKSVMNSHCLSNSGLEVIYKFLTSDDIRVKDRLGKTKPIHTKYFCLVKVIVEANLLEEKLDDLLDLAFECYYRKTYKYSERKM